MKKILQISATAEIHAEQTILLIIYTNMKKIMTKKKRNQQKKLQKSKVQMNHTVRNSDSSGTRSRTVLLRITLNSIQCQILVRINLFLFLFYGVVVNGVFAPSI